VIKLTPAEKAAITRKWRRANAKAQATARNAERFTKYPWQTGLESDFSGQQAWL
jgi:hypothetical protein